jgi:hypothetical protein
MSHITLRGRWCHIIVLNINARGEDKTDYVKSRFYEESLHEISNDNGVRVVNFATSKNSSQKYVVPTLQHG